MIYETFLSLWGFFFFPDLIAFQMQEEKSILAESSALDNTNILEKEITDSSAFIFFFFSSSGLYSLFLY